MEKQMKQDGMLTRGAKLGGFLARVAVVGIALSSVAVVARAADQWIKPTPEELAMKSVPAYPGVPAIYLFREEITKDDLHVIQHYERIKVLTEKGKEYANVELGFVSFMGDGDSGAEDKTVGEVTGRTIHADGTVIPFTGKPYLKTLEKGSVLKQQARIFTLPDVEVGSIIEYRYATRYSDEYIEAARWYLQSPLFTRAAHYMWYPTLRPVGDGDGNEATRIAPFPILPEGVKVDMKDMPGGGPNGGRQRVYEVKLQDVPPAPEEEFMPPIQSFTYRVLFSYTAYATPAEFWKAEGKRWSKKANSFIGPDNTLTAATQPVIAGATTQDEKLRKIYAAIMNMENTDYTRDRQRNEEKAEGIRQIKTAADVLKRGRGNSLQLTYLFVGMARAAGMKAYAMEVPNRARHIFTPYWMNSYQQFANTIAIVNVDGKEIFFGPGERYLPYGHLQWEYTIVQGLRQTDGGTDFAFTPEETYKQTVTSRVANLTMGEDGGVTGTINMTYEGAEATRLRQQTLRGDEESLRHDLETTLEEMVPKTLEVKVKSIENLKEYEKPLKVTFDAKGSIGTPTGKRLVVPVDLFSVGEGVSFTHEKREWPVYFHYPQTVLDALRINLPASLSVEAVPAAGKASIAGLASYTLTPESAPRSVTVRRSFLFGGVIVPVKNYPELRTFYSQLEAKDQESIVLRAGAPAASSAAAKAPGQ